MQRNDRWPSDYDPDPRRRSSASSRSSKKGKKSPPASASSTPKKVAKPDFVVTGKQILKRPDRANSLPASYRRRQSLESVKKKPPSPKRDQSQSSKSRETSLEDDMSLDLSQVSDFEDMSSKYGIRTFKGLATSTPKQKRVSLPQGKEKSYEKIDRKSGRESRDSLFTSNSSVSYRQAVSTDLDYSSVSPEYSGQSSTEISPRQTKEASQDLSSCCVSNWLDGSDGDTKVEDHKRSENGEWNTFWVNYNNSIAKIPMKSYYDQCPTPYRTENIDLADLDFSAEGSRMRSPEDTTKLNSIIRNEGLHLTPRETQNIIKCAHILGNVLSKAIGRRSKEKQNTDKIQELQENKELKKKMMTLELKETNIPMEVKEEKRSETVTTQTDISLPNTKSAPKIFENILRQLSRSSIDEGLVKKAKESLENEVKSEKN